MTAIHVPVGLIISGSSPLMSSPGSTISRSQIISNCAGPRFVMIVAAGKSLTSRTVVSVVSMSGRPLPLWNLLKMHVAYSWTRSATVMSVPLGLFLNFGKF